MTKVVIKILQCSAVMQTVLGGLIMYHLVANFLYCMSVKICENQLTFGKIMNKDKAVLFIRTQCRTPEFFSILLKDLFYFFHINIIFSYLDEQYAKRLLAGKESLSVMYLGLQ